MADNNVVISTELETRSAIQSLKDLKKTVQNAFARNSTAELQRNIKNLERDLSTAEREAKKANTALNDLLSGKTTPKSVEGLENKLKSANANVQKLQNDYIDLLTTSEKPKSVLALEKALQAVNNEAENADKSIKTLLNKIESIESKALTQSGMESATIRAQKRGAIVPKYVEVAQNKFLTEDQVRTIEQLNGQIDLLTEKETQAQQAAIKLDAEIKRLLLNPETTDEAKALASKLQEAVYVSNDLNNSLEKQKAREINNAKEAAQETAAAVVNIRKELEDTQKQAKKGGLARAFQKAKERGEKLIGMMKRMTIRLLFYQTFGKAIRSTVDYIKQAVKADDELSASAARLKGNILTAFQLIYQVVRPIIIAVIALLTRLIGVINALISRLSGKSISSARDSAKALYKLGKAASGAGKEAKKSLASFDELIQIGDKSKDGGAGSTEVTPDFSDVLPDAETSSILESLEAIWGILKWILLVIASIKAYNLLKSLTNLSGVLSGFGKNGALATIAGLALTILYTIKLIEHYSDAWVNGLDWDNFVEVLFDLTMVIIGLGLAFGKAVIPIALIAGSLALIVLSIHDMIENGPNLKNQLMMFIGLIGIVIGLLETGHATLAIIIAVIGAAILIAGNFGDQWENIMEHCGQIIEGFVALVQDLINGDFDAAWEDAQQILKGFVNLGIDLFEGLVKAMAKGINWIIGKINSVIEKITIPDWVPVVGGTKLPLIPEINTEWSLPRLAQGAVIPPNKEFMAVLGDQKSGTNIETPLDTMIQAFNAALDNRGNEQIINIHFTGSLAELARLLKPKVDIEDNRQGQRSSNGLIVRRV